MPQQKEEWNTMRNAELDSLFTEFRKLKGETMSLQENINAMSRRLEEQNIKIEKMAQSVNDLISIQSAFSGTKTFLGWISDTIKYILMVAAWGSAAFYFLSELLAKR